MKLINDIQLDGSRLFYIMPGRLNGYELLHKFRRLSDANLITLFSDHEFVTAINFEYRKFTFRIFYMGFGESGRYEFIANQSDCPDRILLELLKPFKNLTD